MSDSGSYDKHISHRNLSSEIERLAAQAHQGWGKTSRTLSWFGITDGMSALELGSGPGFITALLLDFLPTSQITCLEVDAELILQAKDYLQYKQHDRISFAQESVMDTNLASNQFDFVYARLLFQHLADPVGACQEILRVMKPGGKLVIHDIDDGLFGIFQPSMPGLAEVVESFGQAQASRGGNRHIGRCLWRTLEKTGYCNLDLELLASHSDDIGIDPFMTQLNPDRLQPLVESNLLSEQSLEQFRQSRLAFQRAPDAYALWLSFMVCGQKPT